MQDEKDNSLENIAAEAAIIRADWLSLYALKYPDGQPFGLCSDLGDGDYLNSMYLAGGGSISVFGYSKAENGQPELTEILSIPDIIVCDRKYELVRTYLVHPRYVGRTYSEEIPILRPDIKLAEDVIRNFNVPDTMFHSITSFVDPAGVETLIYSYQSGGASITKHVTLVDGKKIITGVYTPYNVSTVAFRDRRNLLTILVQVTEELVVKYPKSVREMNAKAQAVDYNTKYSTRIKSNLGGIKLQEVKGLMNLLK